MSEPFLAEIRIVGFTYPPHGWATCDGQILSIAQNTALFSLLGTTYGGNGQTTFALPNLNGRVPLSSGQGPGLSNYSLGQVGGEAAVTLNLNQMPSHNHLAQANNSNGTVNRVGQNVWAASAQADLQYAATTDATMNPAAIGIAGGNQPHENHQPSLALLYIIALQGIYPPRP